MKNTCLKSWEICGPSGSSVWKFSVATGIALFAGSVGFGAEGWMPPWMGPKITNGAMIRLVLEQPTVRLGEPVVVTLLASYSGTSNATANSAALDFDSCSIVAPDGRAAPYLGGAYQVESHGIRVPSDGLFVPIRKDFVLSDAYLFDQAGSYSICFRGDRDGFGTLALPSSSTQTVTVLAGIVPLRMQAARTLLSVCPTNWWMGVSGSSYAARTNEFFNFFGRDSMNGEWVKIVFSSADLCATNRIGSWKEQKVNLELGNKAQEAWPDAVRDIRRALNLEPEPPVTRSGQREELH